LDKIILENTNPTISFNLEVNGSNIATSRFDNKNKKSYFEISNYKKDGILEALIGTSSEQDDKNVPNRYNYLRIKKLNLRVYPNQIPNYFYHRGFYTIIGLQKNSNGDWVNYEKKIEFGNEMITVDTTMVDPIKELLFQSKTDFEVSLRF